MISVRPLVRETSLNETSTWQTKLIADNDGCVTSITAVFKKIFLVNVFLFLKKKLRGTYISNKSVFLSDSMRHLLFSHNDLWTIVVYSFSAFVLGRSPRSDSRANEHSYRIRFHKVRSSTNVLHFLCNSSFSCTFPLAGHESRGKRHSGE